MINELRNSVGFRNFASAKKQQVRAPYSAKFQPLLTEVEAVEKADMIEPYSVEQTLHDINEELEEHQTLAAEEAKAADPDNPTQNILDADTGALEQTRLYTGTGHTATSAPAESQPEKANELDDQTIINTLVSDLSEKIDGSFQTLESNLQNAMEKRLGQALLVAFKQQLVAETSVKLKQSISSIMGQNGDAKVVISGPKELIEAFQTHMSEGADEELNVSFSINETSNDLIAQIDETSITSRFDELDNLVSELFK